jgi:hypothetical protein
LLAAANAATVKTLRKLLADTSPAVRLGAAKSTLELQTSLPPASGLRRFSLLRKAVN